MSIYVELQDQIEDDPDAVARRSMQLLDDNPDDSLALFLLGIVYSRAERFGMAVNAFRRVCDLKPRRAEAWANLGMSYAGLKSDKALECYLKAWGLEHKATFAANIASAHIERGAFQAALEWSQKALKLDPSLDGAWTSYGMAQLAAGAFSEGWKGYDRSLGGRFRKETQFQEEGRWTGEKGQTVVVYGEQGLGDEIMYASCIPDAARDARVVLECDPRLQGLFRRSFEVPVHGTRRLPAPWLEGMQLDARCAIGCLPGFYRPDRASFPGTPYLVADPERRVQWRALLDSLGPRPKVGIAWSGGSRHNNPQARALGLEGLRPLIEWLDADFISLQYRDPSAEIAASGLPVRHWKRACETDDYDDTAALVAELDLVVTVPTTVMHLAGALGVPAHCLTPFEADWNFKQDMPWYQSVELFQKGKHEAWSDCVRRYLAGFHWVRPAAADRLQRPAALDHPPREPAGIDHPAGAEPVAA